MPVSGVTDSSVLSIEPYLKARRGELELMAAPGAAPCAVPQGSDRKQALAFLRPLLRAGPKGKQRSGKTSGSGSKAPGSATDGKDGSRGSGASRSAGSGDDPARKGGSRSFVGSAPMGEDGMPLGADMGINDWVTAEETDALRCWMNAVLLKSPLETFPESITEAAGAPIWDLVEALAGSKLPGRGQGQVMTGKPAPSSSGSTVAGSRSSHRDS